MLPAETLVAWRQTSRPGERSEQDWNDPPFSLVPGPRSAWGAGRGRRAAKQAGCLGVALPLKAQGRELGWEPSSAWAAGSGQQRHVSWHPRPPLPGALPASWPDAPPPPPSAALAGVTVEPHRKQAWILLPGCLPRGLLLDYSVALCPA